MECNNNVIKNKRTKSKSWIIPENIDCNELKLDPNGMFTHCGICNMAVKTRTARQFIFSRWNEHLVGKSHQVKKAHKTHQVTIELKAEEDKVLSKVESDVLRKQIGIQNFSSTKKRSRDEISNEECDTSQGIIISTTNTYTTSTTKRVGNSCQDIIPNYPTKNQGCIYYYTNCTVT